MRRRRFLRALGGAGLGVPLLSWAGCRTSPPKQGDFDGWIWVHGDRDHDEADWRRRFARIRSAGVTAVLVSGGPKERVASAARAEGLAFHRWLWTLNRNGDAWAQENHPEWFTVSREGQSSLNRPPYVDYYRWVCPTRAPVRAYLRGLVDQVAADPMVEGVHLDYIRHADVILPRGLWSTYGLVQDREHPEFDFCYCAVCRDTFARAHGVDPLDLPDPTADEAWRRFRWDSVTRLVTELSGTVRARGKAITAAVFPTPAIARRLVRQAWDEWPVDGLFPMLYHSFYEEGIGWIGAGVREGVAALAGTGRRLRAGLYLPDLGAEELAEAVAVARAAGADGVSLFEMEGLSNDHLAALAGAMA